MPDRQMFRNQCRDTLGRDHTDLYGLAEEIARVDGEVERMKRLDALCKAWMEAGEGHILTHLELAERRVEQLERETACLRGKIREAEIA